MPPVTIRNLKELTVHKLFKEQQNMKEKKKTTYNFLLKINKKFLVLGYREVKVIKTTKTPPRKSKKNIIMNQTWPK